MPALSSVVSRRVALAGALALPAALAACTSGPDGAGPTGPSASSSPTADDLTRAAAATRERALAVAAGSGSPTPSTSASSPPPAAPVTAASLARAELAAAAAHQALLAPLSGALARLLASVAAGDAALAASLRTVR